MATTRFQRTQISLRPGQHAELEQIARREQRSLSDIVREMLDEQIAERKKQAMAAGAMALLEDYQANGELTAFNILDGEDVK
jgi:hypothetical protein